MQLFLLYLRVMEIFCHSSFCFFFFFCKKKKKAGLGGSPEWHKKRGLATPIKEKQAAVSACSRKIFTYLRSPSPR